MPPGFGHRCRGRWNWVVNQGVSRRRRRFQVGIRPRQPVGFGLDFLVRLVKK